MFKNLDGFKKVHEDKDTAVMMHPKGHTVSVALKALPAMHRKQLMALPLHKMAEGGQVSNNSSSKPDNSTWINKSNQSYQNGSTAKADAELAKTNTGYAKGGGVQKYAEGDEVSKMIMAPVPDAATAVGLVPPPLSDDDKSKLSDIITKPLPDAASNVGLVPSVSQDNGETAPAPTDQPAAAPGSTPAGAQSSSGSTPPSGYDFSQAPGYSQIAAGIKGTAAAEGTAADAEAKAANEYTQNLQTAEANWQKNQSDLSDHIKSALDDVKAGHIDPKSYVENMGAGQRIATGIGLLLGGFSTPFTHQGNPALEMLNKQIDRDIDAQKNGLNNKMNVYNAYLNQYKDAAVAENMARATQMAIYGSKIKAAAAASGNPLAQAKAQMALGQLQQQMIPYVQKANFLQQTGKINQQAAQTGELSPLPPEQLVKLTGATPEDQNKMYEEIKDNQNIASLRPQILQAFKMGTSKNPVEAAQGQRQFEGLINTTVKEKEGTARQAAFESIHKNMSPAGITALPGENEAKLNTVIKYLQSNSAAPVSKGYGLDLNNYKSTSTRVAPQAPAPVQGKDGKMYVQQGKFMVPVK